MPVASDDLEGCEEPCCVSVTNQDYLDWSVGT